MNSQKLVDLLFDGAYITDGKIFHSSFRKGFRARPESITIYAAENKLNKLGLKLVEIDNVKKIGRK